MVAKLLKATRISGRRSEVGRGSRAAVMVAVGKIWAVMGAESC